MCGIFGFSERTKVTQAMVPILAAAMELRGDDSWGVTDGVHLYKHAESILASYEDHGCATPTYHTRGASVGVISERNAHPFEYISAATGRTVVGVHNGHVVNADELKALYHNERKEFEVDSENIFAQLAEGLPTKDIHGWGAVVWYEYPTGKPKERRRFISCFNNTNLHIVRLSSGELAFASTIESLKIAARFAGVTIKGQVKMVNKMKYELVGNTVKSHGLMEWDERPIVVAAASARSHYLSGRHNDWRSGQRRSLDYGQYQSVCKSWGCSKPTGSEEVICPECVLKFIGEFASPSYTTKSKVTAEDFTGGTRAEASNGQRVDSSVLPINSHQRIWG